MFARNLMRALPHANLVAKHARCQWLAVIDGDEFISPGEGWEDGWGGEGQVGALEGTYDFEPAQRNELQEPQRYSEMSILNFYIISKVKVY